MKIENLVAEWDQLIKAGKTTAVAQLVGSLNLSHVPRSSCQSLAKIFRRIDMIDHGLRLLQPLVRSDEKMANPPTPGEICEYAVLLSRNGSVREALALLETVDSAANPEAGLYSAYCHISNWDYAKAIPLLEVFLGSNADSYSKLVARVNLISACLVMSEWVRSDELLTETMATAHLAGASRLLGNCYELKGRLSLYRGDFASSRAALNQALDIFAGLQIYDRLFIDKWLAVMSALEQKSSRPLTEFRGLALAQKDWESVREADLFTVKVHFDQHLLDSLVYGTPMRSYRERIQREIGGPPSPSFVFGEEKGLLLDLQTGKLDHETELNPGKKIHQMIAALVRDFYVPRNIGTLFSDLYPSEYFDINSSPQRLRELIRRTRQWLTSQHIPAEIQQEDGAYCLVIKGAFGIRIPSDQGEIENSSVQWLELKVKFPSGVPFTARQVCETLSWPRMKFLRAISKPLERGELVKSGDGKSTVYKIAS